MAETRYWLMKTEPESFGIDDLQRDGAASWDGVRNPRARNYMREMAIGDLVLFYHSSCKPPGVAGIARVSALAHPDPTQWDPQSPYFDKRASRERPRWDMVDVAFVEKLPALLTLDAMKADAQLEGMLATRRGVRLSVQPVDRAHFERVLKLAGAKTHA